MAIRLRVVLVLTLMVVTERASAQSFSCQTSGTTFTCTLPNVISSVVGASSQVVFEANQPGDTLVPLASVAGVVKETWQVGARGDLAFSTLNGGYGLTERMRLSFDGGLGVGTSSPASPLHIVDTQGFAHTIRVDRYGSYSDLLFQNAGGTLSSPAPVTSGNETLILRAHAYDGANYVPSAGILFSSEGTISSWQVPGVIRFFTHPQSYGNQFIEAMRIDSARNVGIGTTSPASRLHVNGVITADAASYTSYTPSKLSMGYDTALSRGWIQSGLSSLLLNPNGNSVSIGTTADWGYALGVNGTIGWGDGTSAIGRLTYTSVGGNPAIAAGAGKGFTIYTNNASVEAIDVLSNGNVGIGTTTPQVRTHIQGTSGFPATAGTSQSGALRLQGAGGGAVLDIGVDSAGYRHSWLQASTNYDLGFNQKLLLNPNGGGVAIGTTAPNSLPLEVFRPSSSTTQYASGSVIGLSNLDPTPNNWSELWFAGTNNSVDAGISAKFVDRSTHETNLYLTTRDGSGIGNRVSVLGNGNVGIGTETPTAKLHVAGNITVDGNLSARYQDVAEWVPARERLAPGTVVVIDAEPGVVAASHEAYDTAVAGVISPQPGIVLGEPGADKVLVAQSGRVRVKVDASYGAIRAGDLLVTSPTPGVAMRSEPVTLSGAAFHRPGTLLGKALEPLPAGQGEILVLLTLQ